MELKKHKKLKVVWKDYYHNMTKSKLSDLKDKLTKKYGVRKSDIEVEKKYIQNNNSKIASEIVLDTVLDMSKLHEKYLEYLSENYPNVDINDFLEIDDKVVSQLPKEIDEFDTRNRQYDVLWVRGKNIFSYGFFERTYVDDKGVVIVHSQKPYENAGGKTALSRMVPFLIFGNELIYGYNKTNYKNVFNKYVDDNEAYIEGEIKINDDIYYLKRTLKKSKKGDKVSHKFYIYRYDDVNGKKVEGLNRKAVDLSIKDSIQSLKKFKNIVGTYEDYVFAAYYQFDNVEKWIQTKPKQRYRLFCEYLGLSLLETKYQVAKKILNKFLKTGKSSNQSLEGIKKLISDKENRCVELKQLIKTNENLLKIEYNKLYEIDSQIKKLYDSKHFIDKDVESIDLQQLQKEILNLAKDIDNNTKKITTHKENIKSFDNIFKDRENLKKYQKKINVFKRDLKNINVPTQLTEVLQSLKKKLDGVELPLEDVEALNEQELLLSEHIQNKNRLIAECDSIDVQISELKEGYICSNCGHKEDSKVKQGELVFDKKSKQKDITILSTKIDGVKKKIKTLSDNNQNKLKNLKSGVQKEISLKSEEIENYKTSKAEEIYNKLRKLENATLKFDEYQNTLNALKNLEDKNTNLVNLKSLKEGEVDKYHKNISKIQENKKISAEIEVISTDKATIKESILDLERSVSELNKELDISLKDIEDYKQTYKKVEKEYAYESLLQLYLKVHSEDGLSKHLILSILPQINTDLALLMGNLCDFELSIRFDDKKIEFIMERDGVEQFLYEGSGWEKTLSCLALHYVNIKKSTLPIPNYLVLDEVLGRMNKSNFKYFVNVLNKLAEVFDTIDLITHSHADTLIELFEKELMIAKEGHISKIK